MHPSLGHAPLQYYITTINYNELQRINELQSINELQWLQ